MTGEQVHFKSQGPRIDITDFRLQTPRCRGEKQQDHTAQRWGDGYIIIPALCSHTWDHGFSCESTQVSLGVRSDGGQSICDSECLLLSVNV